jgi:hypothetical protein
MGSVLPPDGSPNLAGDGQLAGKGLSGVARFGLRRRRRGLLQVRLTSQGAKSDRSVAILSVFPVGVPPACPR